jgi:ribonuclease HI
MLLPAVQGNSQLILQQVVGRYKVNSDMLKPYHRKVVALKGEFGTFEMSHIEKVRNGRADELANEAMDIRSSRGSFDVLSQ